MIVTINKVAKSYSIWWLLLIAGIILISIGVYAMIEPWDTFVYLIKYTGIALMASSLLLLAHSILFKSIAGEKKWLVIEGLTDMAFAIVLIFNPFLTVIAFPFLIGCWVFVRGVIKILISLSLARSLHGWVWVLIIGILSVVFGLLIICFPFERAKGISIIMSIFSVITGSLYLFEAFKYRQTEDTLIAMV